MAEKKLIDFKLGELIDNTRKPTAYPGGGALASLSGNLGINLILMMAKKDYKDENLNKKGKKISKKFIAYSQELKDLMQEDVDRVNVLLKAFKNNEMDNIDKLINDANIAPKRTIELMIIVLQDCDFLLENGKFSTISDGEIGLRLVKECIHSSFVNVIMNEKYFDKDSNFKKTDYKSITKYCDKLYEKNMDIIRKRIKLWDK